MAVDLEYAKRVCGCLPLADADAGVAETQDCMAEMIAELARLRAQLAASESKRATLAAECRAERLWHDKCRCGGECECVPGKKLNKARAAVDAANALEGE